jgi:hypothetical protein
MLFSGAWGKMIHDKNLEQKSHDTVPLIQEEMRAYFVVYEEAVSHMALLQSCAADFSLLNLPKG